MPSAHRFIQTAFKRRLLPCCVVACAVGFFSWWADTLAVVTVDSLFRYPVKACAGEKLSKCRVDAMGLHGDRRFVLECGRRLDSPFGAITLPISGRVFTQRELPCLAQVQASLDGDTDDLRLRAPNAEELILPAAESNDAESTADAMLFGVPIQGQDQGDAVSKWLSAAGEGWPLRLLRQPAEGQRAGGGRPAEFMDCSPLLVVSTESLEEVRRVAGWDVPMNRFRPNLVVSGVSRPNEEDTWRTLRIGGVELVSQGPCARCQVVEVNQESGKARDAPGSVLRALASYRQSEGSVYFGAYFAAVKPGTIEVNDRVEAS